MSVFFFFNDTATTEIYTLSLHDALPISFSLWHSAACRLGSACTGGAGFLPVMPGLDRKSTRLNSSHLVISYAVFCLKKKKPKHSTTTMTVILITSTLTLPVTIAVLTHNL